MWSLSENRFVIREPLVEKERECVKEKETLDRHTDRPRVRREVYTVTQPHVMVICNTSKLYKVQ